MRGNADGPAKPNGKSSFILTSDEPHAKAADDLAQISIRCL
jgi:hypothetical protein